MNTTDKKTLVIIKPDISRKNCLGQLLPIWEKKGLRMVGIKMVHLTRRQAEIFYQEHATKPFFASMTEFMASSPVIVICWEGPHAIKLNREIIGATNPAEAEVGTIRKIFGTSIEANAVHGSDSPQAATREINFFFSPAELFSRSE